jgi:tRNA pseudouridine13 synthase
MLGIPHPYLTAELGGVGGRMKDSPEDFVVEEVPLYTACGEGEHTYFEVEKRDLSTPEALERLSRALLLPTKDIGYAGLKDRKGVTRQVLSIGGVAPDRILALDIPQLKVLWARLHRNKLRVGHLRGNRFRIWVRDVQPNCGPLVDQIFAVLLLRGVPNYFGPQRFGNRGDAHRIGRAFLLRDDAAAIRRILGHPSETEHNPHVVRARQHFMAGELDDALASFPSSYREERKLLEYLREAGENYEGARKRLGESTRKLYFTAYQSYLFNLVLSARLRRVNGNLGRLLEGDLAFLHRNGAVFRVENPEQEQPRADAFELSPSGPIFGMKMPSPMGAAGDMEREVVDLEGVTLKDFHQLMPKFRLEGGRRPLRVKMEDLVWRLEGNCDLYVEFFLPKGSYATTVLREVLKNENVPESFYEDGAETKHGLWRPPASAGSPEQESREPAEI